MAKRRGYIPIAELLAAALRQHGNIPWALARGMTAEDFVGYYAINASDLIASSIRFGAPRKRLLVAVLCRIGKIPEVHAEAMGANRVIGLFAKDHGIFKTWEEAPGEFDKHWNLTWRFRGAHIEKTKTDQGVIAKVRKGAARRAEHQEKMAAKAGLGTAAVFEKMFEEFVPGTKFVTRPRSMGKQPKAKILSRPFAKGKRKMQSRNSFAKRGGAGR